MVMEADQDPDERTRFDLGKFVIHHKGTKNTKEVGDAGMTLHCAQFFAFVSFVPLWLGIRPSGPVPTGICPGKSAMGMLEAGKPSAVSRTSARARLLGIVHGRCIVGFCKPRVSIFTRLAT